MLKQLKEEANRTMTENGAATYLTTQSDCLDLFATIGALRHSPDDEIQARFDRAWAENADLAIKTLFFARDVRGGLGERRIFRTILRQIAADRLNSVVKNLWAIPEYGRFDDLLCLLDTQAQQDVLDYIKSQFSADMAALEKGESISLLGKWLPSINAHSAETVRNGKLAAKALGLSDADYRRALTKLRAKIAIIENNLRERDYTFDYEKQPSKALMKYRKAFLRNDKQRYSDFLSRAARGEAVMHTDTLMPYDIIHPIVSARYSPNGGITADERFSMDVTWNALPDFTNGENALVVVDGSGSMYGSDSAPLPIEVAISLGIYFAERNSGAFKNHFITFSENPQLIEIKGADIYDKVEYAMTFNEVANTNIQKVFELILGTAVKHKLPQSDLPSTVYIISDMEFDSCTRGADLSNFEYAKSLFEQHGYSLPDLVFWNVDSRTRQQPVKMNEKGVALVSGASPRVFAMLSAGILSPYAFMIDTLSSERYEKISA